MLCKSLSVKSSIYFSSYGNLSLPGLNKSRVSWDLFLWNSSSNSRPQTLEGLCTCPPSIHTRLTELMTLGIKQTCRSFERSLREKYRFQSTVYLQHLPQYQALVSVSCLTPCNPKDHKVHGILQASILEWVTFPFSRGSSQPRDRTQVSRIAGRFFTSWVTREAITACAKQISWDSEMWTWERGGHSDWNRHSRTGREWQPGDCWQTEMPSREGRKTPVILDTG